MTTPQANDDVVLHDPRDFADQEDGRVTAASSDDQKRNAAENKLCKQRPNQCVAWAMAGHAAFAFQDTENSKKIIAKGASAKDKDDRKQALRHQFWMARMTYSMGDAAWDWAKAHESASDPKSRDSICDMRNNLTGNQIGKAATDKDLRGDGAIALPYITNTVSAGVRAGKYCRR